MNVPVLPTPAELISANRLRRRHTSEPKLHNRPAPLSSVRPPRLEPSNAEQRFLRVHHDPARRQSSSDADLSSIRLRASMWNRHGLGKSEPE